MSEDLLKQARQWRDLVLLAELGGWLHDLGKLSKGFVLSKADEAYNARPRGEDTEAAQGGTGAAEEPRGQDEKWLHGEVFAYDAGVIGADLWAALERHLTGRGGWLEEQESRLRSDQLSVRDLVQGHHWKRKCMRGLQALLKRGDGDDSGEDQYNAVGIYQTLPVQASTVFGKEEQLAGGDLASLDDLRRQLCRELGPLLTSGQFPNNRREVWKHLKGALRHALGKTQRAANDVRLDHHVWGVTARFKALLVRSLLKRLPGDQVHPGHTFRLLTIRWDAWATVTPFARLSDVVGREVMLARLREALRRTIEEEYALGNMVYEDDDGIHFMVADVDLKEELIPLIQDRVNEVTGGEVQPVIALSEDGTEWVTDLVGQMEQARKTLPRVGRPAWTEAWDDAGSREVCPVCQRRPSGGEERPCPWCEGRRGEGIRERLAQEGTVWTGEIADRNGRVALLAGRYDLERWLEGEILHTVFITSPEDILTGYRRWQEEEAGDRHHQDLRDALERREVEPTSWMALGKALSQLDEGRQEKQAWIATLNELTGTRKEMQQKREKKRRWSKTIAAPDTPPGKKADLEGRSRKLDREIPELESQSADLVSRLVTLPTLEAAACHHLEKYERKQRTEAMADKIAGSYSLHRDDAYLLALARKNPSASRLLRVWQTTESFLDQEARGLGETVGQRRRVVLTLDRQPRPGIYTAEVPGLGRTDVFVRPEGRQAQTITRMQSSQIQKIRDRAPGAQLRLVQREQGSPLEAPQTYTVTAVEAETYLPYQVITVSPNLLLAMVPADRAPAAAERMQGDYAEAFGKVQGRLPFHVGLVFMDAHYPMFAALDAARRLVESFDALSDEPVEAELTEVEPDDGGDELILSMRSERFGGWTWEVPTRRGDGETDWYHPYVLVRDGENVEERTMSLIGPGGRWVHVSQLEAGDRLAFWPNLFDFLFLDTVSRRLEAEADPGTRRRPHALLGEQHSPRPYLLERVAHLQRIWNAICGLPGMSETRLTAAASLLARKWEAWGLGKSDDPELWETYRWLTREVIKRDFGGGGAVDLHQAIEDGTFFDTVELHRHILKDEVKASSEQQTKETIR
jgi:hypothetical protein